MGIFTHSRRTNKADIRMQCTKQNSVCNPADFMGVFFQLGSPIHVDLSEGTVPSLIAAEIE